MNLIETARSYFEAAASDFARDPSPEHWYSLKKAMWVLQGAHSMASDNSRNEDGKTRTQVMIDKMWDIVLIAHKGDTNIAED